MDALLRGVNPSMFPKHLRNVSKMYLTRIRKNIETNETRPKRIICIPDIPTRVQNVPETCRKYAQNIIKHVLK